MVKIALLGNEIPQYFSNIMADLVYVQKLPCALYFHQENGDMAQLLYTYGQEIAKNSPVTVHRAVSLAEALTQANGLIYAHDVQSTSRYHTDVAYMAEIDPDCRFLGNRSPYSGMAGLMQGLRQGTGALPLCERVKTLAPQCKTMVLSSNTSAIIHLFAALGLEAVGFDTSFPDSEAFEKSLAELPTLEEESLHFKAAGLEHFAWITAITGHSKLSLQQLKDSILSKPQENDILAKWIDLYDGLAYGDVQKIGQYLPAQPGILPMDEVIFTENITLRKERIIKMNQVNQKGLTSKEGQEAQIALLSQVDGLRPVQSLFTCLGLAKEALNNQPLLAQNKAYQIKNLPPQAVVVTNTLEPTALEEEIADIARGITRWQISIAKATLTGDWALLRLAIDEDTALANTDRLAIFALLQELMEAHEDVLPQFFNQ